MTAKLAPIVPTDSGSVSATLFLAGFGLTAAPDSIASIFSRQKELPKRLRVDLHAQAHSELCGGAGASLGGTMDRHARVGKEAADGICEIMNATIGWRAKIIHSRAAFAHLWWTLLW